MDKLKSFIRILLVTLTTITAVCNASDEISIYKKSQCKTLKVDTDGTTIKWRKLTLNCKIKLRKKDFWDDKICVKMLTVNLENYRSSVKFRTSFSILKEWTTYSSKDKFEVCTSSSSPYIELDLHDTYGARFDLKLYTKNDAVVSSSGVESEIETAVHATGMTLGIIVAIVIGLIVMVIVFIICICCCCMKGRQSQGHVYRQTPQTTTYQLTTQGQPQSSYPPQTTQGQPQSSYPPQTTQQPQAGVDGYSVQQPPVFAGYPSQPGGYTTNQPPLGGYTATQPPQVGYTVHPPPAASAPPSYNQYQGYPPPQQHVPPQPSAPPSAPPLENTSYPEKSAPPPYPSVN